MIDKLPIETVYKIFEYLPDLPGVDIGLINLLKINNKLPNIYLQNMI